MVFCIHIARKPASAGSKQRDISSTTHAPRTPPTSLLTSLLCCVVPALGGGSLPAAVGGREVLDPLFTLWGNDAMGPSRTRLSRWFGYVLDLHDDAVVRLTERNRGVEG